MKPEKKAKAQASSKPEEYLALGIPAEWVEPMQALGYTSIVKLKEVEKPGKLHQEMMSYRKKNKLAISTLCVDDIANWIS